MCTHAPISLSVSQEPASLAACFCLLDDGIDGCVPLLLPPSSHSSLSLADDDDDAIILHSLSHHHPQQHPPILTTDPRHLLSPSLSLPPSTRDPKQTPTPTIMSTSEDSSQQATSRPQHAPALADQIQSEIEEGVAHLKHVPPPAEKVILPSAGDIQQEKTEQALVQSITQFDTLALRQVDTEEKVILPSAADIAAEKRLSSSGAGAGAQTEA